MPKATTAVRWITEISDTEFEAIVPQQRRRVYGVSISLVITEY